MSICQHIDFRQQNLNRRANEAAQLDKVIAELDMKEQAQKLAEYYSAIGPDTLTKKDTMNFPKIEVPLFNTCKINVPLSPGKKFDGGKPDYTLLPFNALEEVVEVLGFGAIKYGRDNWQSVERQRYVAAAFRHLTAIAKGETQDEESGKSHAAHLACCALFLGELNNS